MIALISGAVILFPTIYTALQPPFLVILLLYAFWGLGTVALCLLFFAFYVAHFVDNKIPHRSCGAGNYMAFASLGCLFVFILTNLYDDYNTGPTIVELKVEPVVVAPGSAVRLTSVAEGKRANIIEWKWSINSHDHGVGYNKTLSSSIRSAYWTVPSDLPLGRYYVTVTARLQGEISDQAKVIVTVRNDAE